MGLIETSGCPWFFDGGPFPWALSPNDYVELERTPCLGICPGYVVRIQADGSVHWQGQKSVTVLGGQNAKINPTGAAKPIRTFLSRGGWFLCSRYIQEITDLPSWTTTVRIGNREKRVLDYASSAPKWLRDLDSQIDWLIGSPVLTGGGMANRALRSSKHGKCSRMFTVPSRV